MELNTEEIGEVTVVSVLTQVIDAGNADDFKTGFASIVKGCKKIVLELSRVNFIDSSGCGSLLSCHRQIKSLGGDLKICGPQEMVRTLFDLVRMYRVVDIFDSKEEAVKAFLT
ncbi:MAG: anti-sigma B factor antagonist [Desulfobacteraceae bacterium Eth-SRB2]|nr:MAG: anti-sigma B factor antagonist [Desulfobacteraceae bacterium Eth-SRB2]